MSADRIEIPQQDHIPFRVRFLHVHQNLFQHSFGLSVRIGNLHFAGLKAVGESVAKPWEYYYNNISGTLVLVDVMRRHGVKNIIFIAGAACY